MKTEGYTKETKTGTTESRTQDLNDKKTRMA
jgi:hypothetical protein